MPKSTKSSESPEIYVKNLKRRWLESAEDLAKAKEGIKKGDLFGAIDYLILCDQIRKTIYTAFKEIDSLAKQSKIAVTLNAELKEVQNSMQKKLQTIDEEYAVFADKTLRKAEDRIAQLAEINQKDKLAPPVSDEISQNLDNELFLQELKDSLESYREAREAFLVETGSYIPEKLPRGKAQENLSKQESESDSVISQLDTAITACDLVLLSKKIAD